MDARTGAHPTGAEVRRKVSHPIVDGDGHLVESPLVFLDYVRQIAGPKMVARLEHGVNPPGYAGVKGVFWGQPSGPHTVDRATAMLPKLYAERLDAAGIDFGVVYSTMVLSGMHLRDDEARIVFHRALNAMLADIFSEVKHRLTPSAAIPMFTPSEAIDELDHAIGKLGLKAATFGTEVRVIPQALKGKLTPEQELQIEKVHPVALDALCDYDPVWQKALDLKVTVACHTGDRGGLGRRASPSNYVFNHLGCFSSSNDYFARAIFMDGVTRRFPGLNFAFLEGGVAWACQLYNDLIEHWEKRNAGAMRANLDPAALDLDLMAELARTYGGNVITPAAVVDQPKRGGMGGIIKDIEIDDFRRCAIAEPRDIVDLFVEPFYFGCEADDRMNAVAFDKRLNHFGVKLKAMFGSDIGHWDVNDMTECVAEAYELVEEGLFSEDDFRDFMYVNPVSFFTRSNPDFFKGTVIADAAATVVAQT